MGSRKDDLSRSYTCEHGAGERSVAWGSKAPGGLRKGEFFAEDPEAPERPRRLVQAQSVPNVR
ncbi:MAG: hypothetical protein DRN83_01765 [Hadesarchaea archaeon]|nr:MAG: hypothetical protein DRN83_01765 [Hadesarchaea archaeon]